MVEDILKCALFSPEIVKKKKKDSPTRSSESSAVWAVGCQNRKANWSLFLVINQLDAQNLVL